MRSISYIAAGILDDVTGYSLQKQKLRLQFLPLGLTSQIIAQWLP
jgi:hypothetical protein